MCFLYKSVPHGKYYNVTRAASWKRYPLVAMSFYCWPYFKLFLKAFLLYFPLGKKLRTDKQSLNPYRMPGAFQPIIMPTMVEKKKLKNKYK